MSSDLFGGITVAMLHSVQQESELRWGADRAFRLLAFKHSATLYSHVAEKGIAGQDSEASISRAGRARQSRRVPIN